MTKDQLRQIAKFASSKNIELFYPHLEKWMPHFGISGKQREAAFIAQIIHESGSFRYVKELASGQAYEGRKDLGNIMPGDGPRYKGRGLIQITGRHNYEEISKALSQDFINNPELLEQPENAVQSACWWWTTHGLNPIADAGDFVKITKRINGGINGLKDRQEHYQRALSVL